MEPAEGYPGRWAGSNRVKGRVQNQGKGKIKIKGKIKGKGKGKIKIKIKGKGGGQECPPYT